MKSIRIPDKWHQAGAVAYMHTPGALHDALWCRLPSGRLLCYPGAKRELVDGEYGARWVLTAMKGSLLPKRNEEWPRVTLWHGLLAENVTQATAADLLRHALRELVLEDRAPVIGHTHDEIILECPRGMAKYRAAQLKETMETPPPWAEGLPLAVETGTGVRYGK